MSFILLEVQKKIEIKNPEVSDTKNGKIIISSRCQLCSSKRWRFITEQGASRLLWQLGFRTPLSKILLLLVDVCARNASEATGIYKQYFRTIYKTTKQDYKNSEKRNTLDIPVKTKSETGFQINKNQICKISELDYFLFVYGIYS